MTPDSAQPARSSGCSCLVGRWERECGVGNQGHTTKSTNAKQCDKRSPGFLVVLGGACSVSLFPLAPPTVTKGKAWQPTSTALDAGQKLHIKSTFGIFTTHCRWNVGLVDDGCADEGCGGLLALSHKLHARTSRHTTSTTLPWSKKQSADFRLWRRAGRELRVPPVEGRGSAALASSCRQ